MSVAATMGVDLGDFVLDAELFLTDGAVVALVGPNGAGKTTALRVLAGLHALDRGRVVLDDDVLDDPDADRFVPPAQRRVGVVFQDYLLFPHLTALDNVAFGLRARGVPRAEADHLATDWLARVGLADRARHRAPQLSGGEAQRVALVRALAPEPRLLLLDEPLAALDAGARIEVRAELRRHLDDFAGATLLITHDPLDARALADHVVVLDAGQVVQAGPIADVMRRPRSGYVARVLGAED